MKLKLFTKNSPDAIEFSKYVKNLAENLGFKITEKDPDVVLVIGGDGTLLRAVKDGIPILGVKFGRRSALLDIRPENIKEALELLQKNKYTIEEYPMLEAKSRNINTIAFNEIAILFNNPETVYGSVNIKERKILFEGDGVLIATPQGSWAWSYSATRVLLHKDINGIEITFINPIIPNIKALIVPQTETIFVKLEDKGRTQNVRVISDGEIVGNLISKEDEELTITLSKRKAKILRFFNLIEFDGLFT
ncbi:NAD(+)/NADH kinase [Sulfolobus sp. S-194]|uniref:NAD(+)/NADH kinase n=1 Tax=Sulfolobus sp. S-194 TaxID=2512240 RepID=UPI00143736AB|nr:NAD(+)/NADH kinase [Sulfolobus sp. S-194]QIW24930.1 NAD(+)/NADH kinase [Sulfolobus sp. S-194]